MLQQAAHYQVVPLVLINLKGCPATAQTQQLVEGVKVNTEGGQPVSWTAQPYTLAAYMGHVIYINRYGQQSPPTLPN